MQCDNSVQEGHHELLLYCRQLYSVITQYRRGTMNCYYTAGSHTLLLTKHHALCYLLCYHNYCMFYINQAHIKCHIKYTKVENALVLFVDWEIH